MSEPTSNQPDVKRPVAKQTAKAAVPTAQRLDAPPDEKKAKKPQDKTEVIAVKSSAVIAKSHRVRELPPPPVVAPIAATPQAKDLLAEAKLPDILATSAETKPVELGDLEIRYEGKGIWSNLRRRAHLPPRWERWLTDPQRRTNVGLVGGASICLVLVFLSAYVFKAPAQPFSPPPLHARAFPVGRVEEVVSAQQTDDRTPALLVRSAAAPLESVALDLPAHAGGADWEIIAPDFESRTSDFRPPVSEPKSQISNLRSESSNLKSQISNLKSEIPDTQPQRASPIANDSPRVAHGPFSASPSATTDTAIPGTTAGARDAPDLLQATDAWMQGKLKRRTPSGRSEGVVYGGGTPQSEEAVERAVRWIVAHQRDDGSWSFNHLVEGCSPYCTDPGSEPSTTAATGLALLPLLGAGYTHKQGDFQRPVQRGLDYLKQRAVQISYGKDLRDGSSMYGHALATIALCEAYGMTHDPELKETAQGALDYIKYAQEWNSGGWRYNPGEPGDTTVTGWMLMALKSGQMAGLEVNSPEIFAAQRFLDSVQSAGGSQYSYLPRQKPGQGTTAVGLLCRMYTGWRRTNPGLIKGAAQLGGWGPSKDNLYYDYYATQVLFHYAGPEWADWNRKMRDRLISTQMREGHPAGSWYFDSPQSAAGGRLYNTAMAAMILEVYYRFMPLYGDEAVEGQP